MKKIIVLLLTMSMLCSQIICVNASSDFNYSFDYGQYTSEISGIYNHDNYIYCNFTENDVPIELKIEKNMRYVLVNDVPYSFDDYNNAVSIQTDTIYNGEKNTSVLDALNNFTPISNIAKFLKESDQELQLFQNNNSDIRPLASYGVFYDVGTYSKKSMTISLVSSAISLIVSYITSGLGFSTAKSYVTNFVATKLAEWAVDKLVADVWYKVKQAIMNSKGTTKERRYIGIKRNSTIHWNSSYIERTFESQRPIS